MTDLPSPKKNKPFKFGFHLLIGLTLLVALTSFYMNRQLARTIEKNTKRFNENLNMLIQQQSSTEARLQAYRAVTQSHEARAEQSRAALEKNIQEKLAALHHVSDDWQLLKIRHLLELAELNAHWSTDTASTIAILKTADNMLSSMHNPRLIAVRKALALDILATENAPTADITGLLTQLDTALTRTWTLPITPLPKETQTPSTTKPNDQTHTVLNFLNQFVTIRYHANIIEPKPTLAFEAILRATVRLNLEEAQCAVLERNDKLYQLALNQAIRTLSQSFVADSTPVKTFIQSLNELKEISLAPQKVFPEQALNAINKIIADQNKMSSGDAS